MNDKDSEYQIYLNNFIKVCQNPEDNAAIDLLTQKARSNEPDDFRLFLEYNLYIFQNPQIHPSASFFSVIFIMNAFRRIPDIKNKWFDDKVLRAHQEVKNTIIGGLENENVSIRNVCSEIIANIVKLEENSWPDVCAMLISNIRTQSTNHLRALGSIRCLSDIFYFPFIINMPPKMPLPDFMMELIMSLIYAIGEENLFIPSRIDACTALIEITNQFPFDYNNEMINTIMQIVVQSLKFDDLYQDLFKLLTCIVENNYNSLKHPGNNTISNINNVIHNEIATKKGPFKIIAISYLAEISYFEKKKGILDQTFSCSTATEFVDQLLQCLIDIEDPQNLEPEDPLTLTSHNAAITALRAFFYHNAQVIFENVDSFFHKYIVSQNWIEVHAAIYSIASICVEPSIGSDKPYYYTIKDFLESILPYIIAHAGENAMCLRTKDTSMWIISSIFECYPTIAQNDDAIPKILTLFSETMNPKFPPIIIKRSCNIFASIAPQCNKIFLDSNFKKITEIILMIIQNLEPTMDIKTIQRPFSALNSLINNCSNSCDQQILDLFNMFVNLLQNGNCPEILISQISLTSAAIIKKIPNAFRQNAEQLMLLFIRLIDITTQPPSDYQQKDFNYSEYDIDKWENVLITLANLIDIIDKNYQVYSSLISNSVFNALNTNQLNLIKLALKTLGKLYEYFPKELMNEYLEPTLDSITLLISSKPPDSILPLRSSIIFLYGKMFAKLGSEYIDFRNQKHNEMINRIDQAWADGLQPDDYIDLYSCIVYSYRCLFIGFSKHKDFLKVECDKIFAFFKMIYDQKAFNDELLRLIYDLLKLIGETLQEEINLKINKRYIRQLVKISFDNPKLEKIAKDLMEFLSDL